MCFSHFLLFCIHPVFFVPALLSVYIDFFYSSHLKSELSIWTPHTVLADSTSPVATALCVCVCFGFLCLHEEGAILRT